MRQVCFSAICYMRIVSSERRVYLATSISQAFYLLVYVPCIEDKTYIELFKNGHKVSTIDNSEDVTRI